MENAAKDNLPGRCPNCRKEYDRERITKGQVDPTKLAKEQEKKRKKDSKLKYRPGEGMSRKHLQNVRVIQRNLVYAIGVPLKHCKEETLKRVEFFGKYGKILKISVNRNGVYSNHHHHSSSANGGGPTGSAYVTFMEEDDSVNCIKKIDGSVLDGHVIRACFGTTKYCNAFLKYQPCNNPDCLYLHEIGQHADSFTKEEMARIGTKHHSFHELNASRSVGGTVEITTHNGQPTTIQSVQRRQELGLEVAEEKPVAKVQGHALNGNRNGSAPTSQFQDPAILSAPGMNNSISHPPSTSYPQGNGGQNGMYVGGNSHAAAMGGFGGGLSNFANPNNRGHQTIFSSSSLEQQQQQEERPQMQMAGEIFLNHISQQMLLSEQANKQNAQVPPPGMGGSADNQNRQYEILGQQGDPKASLGSGFGGLFGASGGGYNFDLSQINHNNNGFQSMAGMHQTVTEIESKMMSNDKESALLNSSSSRTTSRFSFANRNGEAGQAAADGRGGNVKQGDGNSIPVPPGFSA
jgi:CCR4-NOT transcription complex subunit 4